MSNNQQRLRTNESLTIRIGPSTISLALFDNTLSSRLNLAPGNQAGMCFTSSALMA